MGQMTVPANKYKMYIAILCVMGQMIIPANKYKTYNV